MKTKTTLNILPFFLFFLFCSSQYSAQTPGWQWAKRVGSFSDNPAFSSGDQNERFNDIKVDSLGNVYAVGEFFQNSAFNNTTTGFPTTGGYGERDAYLMKFNKCGKTLWWRRMGGTQRDAAKSLVLDKNGKVIVLAGSGSSTYTVGDGSHDTTITGSNIVYLAKFDTAGNFLSVINTYTGFPNFFGVDFTTKLFIDSQNNYFISDGMQAVRANTLGVAINYYNYTATAGNFPKVRGIALDKNDNVYMSGFITNSVVVGGTTVAFTNGQTNSIIYKFSPTGILLWVNTGNNSNPGGDILGKCTIDTSGTVFATAGLTNAGIVFGYSVSVPPSSPSFSGYGNIFYFFSTSTGSLISAVTATPQGLDFISPLHTDRNNNIHCAGTMSGYFKFGTNTYSTNPVTTTRQNCIAKLDLSGNLLNFSTVPQSGSSNGSVREGINGLVTDKLGNVYVAGMFGGTLDSLGTGVGIIGGSEDGFVAKYGYPCGAAPSGSVPNVPLALTATNNGSLTNNVSWTDNSNNENNFELHYTISPSVTYSLLATLPANTTSYAHTGLSYSTTYCYKVAATNTIGMSAFSNTDCATTPAAPTATSIPNAPLNLSAVNNGSLTNNVAWTDNSSDEANFELHFTSNTTYSLLVTLPPNTTSYAHTGLSYTTTYCYKVAATNSVGASAFSNTACATTPAAPTNTTETGIAKNTVDKKTILCYPNPATTEIYFDVPGTEKQTDIEIYNALGSLVLINKNYANRSAIDVSTLSRGLYYYKIKTYKNEFSGKVVKE